MPEPHLADALNVSVEDLVVTNGKKKCGAGPTGRMRQLFEAALDSRAASNKRSFPYSKPDVELRRLKLRVVEQ